MYQGIATKVMTKEVRLSYVHLVEPYANPAQPGSEPKYSVTLLIPKTDTATKADIDAAMKAAYEQEPDRRARTDGHLQRDVRPRQHQLLPLHRAAEGRRSGPEQRIQDQRRRAAERRRKRSV